MSQAYSDLVRHMIELAQRGDRDAASFVLEEFVNHADAIQEGASASDAAVVGFIARAIREILAGVQPKRALCLGEGGRPRIPFQRNILIAVAVYHEYMACKAAALESASINTAIAAVARREGVPERTVEAAWRGMGGEERVAALVALMRDAGEQTTS